MSDGQKPISSSTYTLDYYLTDCEGHDEYVATGGVALSTRLRAALALAGPLKGLRVLDLGTGRGEVVRHCLAEGARAIGADYSIAALELARRILPQDSPPLVRADAGHLPFADAAFDLVFMLDMVEHLLPVELAATYAEVRRVLTPGGRLIIHTMPNLWYYRYGYPLFRFVQRLRGVGLPRNPRHRSQEQHVHVYEQTLFTLGRDLRAAGFTARVELRNTQDFAREGNPLMRRAMSILATVRPFAWVFCNDLFAVATPPAQPTTICGSTHAAREAPACQSVSPVLHGVRASLHLSGRHAYPDPYWSAIQHSRGAPS